nr:hypothetical protein [Mobiluncus curtisii]
MQQLVDGRHRLSSVDGLFRQILDLLLEFTDALVGCGLFLLQVVDLRFQGRLFAVIGVERVAQVEGEVFPDLLGTELFLRPLVAGHRVALVNLGIRLSDQSIDLLNHWANGFQCDNRGWLLDLRVQVHPQRLLLHHHASVANPHIDEAATRDTMLEQHRVHALVTQHIMQQQRPKLLALAFLVALTRPLGGKLPSRRQIRNHHQTDLSNAPCANTSVSHRTQTKS